MKKSQRILIISPFFSPNVGGVETHLDDLCTYLAEKRQDVQVITYMSVTTRAKAPRNETKGSVQIHRVKWFATGLFRRLEPYPPIEFLYLMPGLFVSCFFYLARHGKSVRILHAHGLVAGFIAVFLGKFFRKRVVLSTHAVYRLGSRKTLGSVFKGILNRCDRILCLSNESKDELINAGVGKEKISVYTYWVDQRIFKPREKRLVRRTHALPEKFTVLFVGRLIDIKGADIVLEVARFFSDNAAFVFIGDGPLSPVIMQASKKQANTVFVGRVDNKDLPDYYCAADVLVVPSRYAEGFGRVILEALSCGTPVIGADCQGIREAMDTTVGVFIKPDTQALRKALNELITDKALLSRLQSACRDFAEKRYSSRNGQLILEAYNDLPHDSASKLKKSIVEG